MIIRFILMALVFYIIYKVVFEFIIPVAKTTQKIRRQFGDMQQHMNDQMNASQNTNKDNGPVQPKPADQKKNRAGEYIDFEEVD